MLRRKPFSLPYADAVPRLATILRGGAPPKPISGELADAALYHSVAGYLLPDADAPDVLVDRYTRAVLRSALLRRALREIVVVLGATPVLLKGPAIADRFYPEPSLRTFADLDLLVPRNALRDAIAALADIGYAPREEFRPGFAETFGHDVHLVGPRELGRVDVELHWRIGDDPVAQALDQERLFSGGVDMEVGDTTVRAPDPADPLLVLAVHLLSDRAKRLIWVQDLVLVSEAIPEDDWEHLFTEADGLGLGWVLHRALDYAAELLEYDRARPLPSGLPPRWGPLRAAEELDIRAAPHVGRLALLGWSGRARYLRDVLVPTRAGLEGTVGGDGAAVWRLAARHAGRAVTGLTPRRSGRRARPGSGGP